MLDLGLKMKETNISLRRLQELGQFEIGVQFRFEMAEKARERFCRRTD